MADRTHHLANICPESRPRPWLGARIFQFIFAEFALPQTIQNTAGAARIRRNPSAPSVFRISSGSGQQAGWQYARFSRLKQGQNALYRPGGGFLTGWSPSKHNIGSGCSFHTSWICCSVRAVPSGARAAPHRWPIQR